MLRHIADTALHFVSPHAAYRLGRKMYMHARGDVANDMHTNGEFLVQRSVVAANKGRTDLTIFDVGANIGDWTLALLRELDRQGASAQVYSFEPVPSTAQTLRSRLPQDRPGLHVEELALSSQPGSAEIFILRDNAGVNSLHKDSSGGSASVTVALDSAAHFADERGIPHVHLLKCDTEGHDMEVIRGALPLLRSERVSVLQFEYNHRWVFSRNFLRDVFLAVRDLPYRVAKLQRDRLLVMQDWHPELEKFFESNYALVHRDALGWFPADKVSFDISNVPVRAAAR